jgi:outer membrane receptor protein involved in Fe transport
LYAQIADPAATNGIGLAQKVVSTSSSGTKGIEFESFGKITDKLTFLLNAYYVISSHTLYFVTPVGKESFVTNYPIAGNPDTVAGYATYNFAGNGRHGLSLTAGFKTIFSGWRMNSTFVRPAKYPETNTIVDLGISYGFSKHWELYLKGNNVFSRIPFPTADVGVAYGRKILGGVTARF